MVEDGSTIFGEEMLMAFSSKALSKMQTLPADAKLDLLEQAEASGKPPTIKEVAAVQGKTETKISKAAELLQEAHPKGRMPFRIGKRPKLILRSRLIQRNTSQLTMQHRSTS